MMPLEELVMVPLENTYIISCRKTRVSGYLFRRLYYYHLPGPGCNLCIRSVLMTFARRAIFHFVSSLPGSSACFVERWQFQKKKLAGLEKLTRLGVWVDPPRWQLIRRALGLKRHGFGTHA